MRQLVTVVVLALVCSGCVRQVAPEADATDTTEEASAEFGDLDPGAIGGGGLNLGGSLDRSGPEDSSSGMEPLASLAECYAVARTGREAREAFVGRSQQRRGERAGAMSTTARSRG